MNETHHFDLNFEIEQPEFLELKQVNFQNQQHHHHHHHHHESANHAAEKKKGALKKRVILTETEKQTNHNESERRRQQSINEGIERLKLIVPGCQDHKISKATVLSRSVSFIEILKNQLSFFKNENIRLKEIIQTRGQTAQPTLYNIDGPSLSSDGSSNSSNPSSPIEPKQKDKSFKHDQRNPELRLSSTAAQILEEEIAVQKDKEKESAESVNIYMPHGTQYPSVNTDDLSNDAFLVLFMFGFSYILIFGTDFQQSMESIKSSRTLMSIQSTVSGVDIFPFVGTTLKIFSIYLIGKSLISYRSLVLFKRNKDLEVARKHRFLGEVSLCSSDFEKARDHFNEALAILGDCIGFIPSEETVESHFQVFKQSFIHFLHYFKPFLLLDGLLMKLKGTTASSREAKLCLIGLFNAKEALNPNTFDLHSTSILLAAINLAECLDPHSQRMANIYTIWGTYLSSDETLQGVANCYYKSGLRIAKNHGPFAVSQINSIWNTKKTIRKKKENLSHIQKSMLHIVYLLTVLLQSILLLINGTEN